MAEQQKNRGDQKWTPRPSLCIGCRRVTIVRAWPKNSLEWLFGLTPDEIPIEAWWHAGLCDQCGIGLWNALSDHQRMHIKSAPESVFISKFRYNPDLAGAMDTLYRSAMNGSEITTAAINRARRALREHRRVVGEFVMNGHGNDDADTQQAVVGPTKASLDAKQAQESIVAATVKAAQTGGQGFAFVPRDGHGDPRHNDPNWGAMKRRPEKARKAEGKKKGAGKRERRQQRFG